LWCPAAGNHHGTNAVADGAPLHKGTGVHQTTTGTAGTTATGPGIV